MPIRRSPANRSCTFSTSVHTRATIAPTVRQAIRINSHTAVFEHCTASHATVSSKPWVCPALCRAHGTAITVAPCSGQSTRGASASSSTCTVPRSNARHRRRPSPRSYHGAFRWHRPHRPRAPRRGRTWATTNISSSSNSTSSITVRLSTPSSPRHRLMLRTPFLRSLVSDLRQARNLTESGVLPRYDAQTTHGSVRRA